MAVPNREPEEPRLKDLVEVLGKSACQIMWNDRLPLRNTQNKSKEAEFWEWFGIGADPRSKWSNFHPDRDAYTEGVEGTGRRILEVLRGQFPSGMDADYRVDFGPNETYLTRAEGLRLVRQHWETQDAERLNEAIDLLQKVNERRARRALDHGAPEELDAMLAAGAQRLTIPVITDPISPVGRRKLFLRTLYWKNVCNGGYCQWPILEEKFVPECRRFLEGSPSTLRDFVLPVFWIGGRSGDGKSILLFQLVREMLAGGDCPPVVLFASPDSLLDWLDANRTHPALAGPDLRLIAVVDDFHKLTDWHRAREMLERAATQRVGLAILTCGPSPERDLFAAETTTVLSLTRCDTRSLDAADWNALADHLDIELVEGDVKATLVERVFFSLPDRNEQSLHAFAESLRGRIEGRVDRTDLLEQLTAMTMLDLALPQSYVGADNAAWLDVLSEETQLHIDHSEAGYRFGHPAIAGPLFEALTSRGRPVRMEYRLADTLTPILKTFGSIKDVVRVLRQVQARLKVRKEGDGGKVLEGILQRSTSQTVNRAAAITIINARIQEKTPLDSTLVSLARTMRSDHRADRETRAYVTKQLATAVGAESDDRSKAFKAMTDKELAPLMAPFVYWLVRKDAGLMASSKAPVLSWIERNRDSNISQTVLASYLSKFSDDPDVRRVTIDFVHDVDVQRLTATLVQACAKRLEDETVGVIREWLAWRYEDFVAAEVLATLLAKRGSTWQAEATAYLSALPKSAPDYMRAFSRLLPSLEHSKSLQEDIDELARRPDTDSTAKAFFDALATGGRQFEVVDHLERRLRVLLERNGGDDVRRSEGYDLLGKSWELVGERFPHYASKVEEIFNVAAAGPQGPGRDRVHSAAHAAAIALLGRGAHAHLFTRAALAVLKRGAPLAVEGLLAACLLQHGPRIAEADADAGLLVAAQQDLLREIAWRNALSEKGGDNNAQQRCSIALIRTMRPEEMSTLRASFSPHWITLPTDAVFTLDAWLKNEMSREDAWEILLSDEIRHKGSDQARARIVSRNLHLSFERLKDGSLSVTRERILLDLLRQGIAHYPPASWFAVQNLSAWPQNAEAHIWRGVLVSALERQDLSRAAFWESFAEWQTVNHDIECRHILMTAGVSIPQV